MKKFIRKAYAKLNDTRDELRMIQIDHAITQDVCMNQFGWSIATEPALAELVPHLRGKSFAQIVAWMQEQPISIEVEPIKIGGGVVYH